MRASLALALALAAGLVAAKVPWRPFVARLADLELSPAQLEGVVKAVQAELENKEMRAVQSEAQVSRCLKQSARLQAALLRHPDAPHTRPSLGNILAPRGPQPRTPSTRHP